MHARIRIQICKSALSGKDYDRSGGRKRTVVVLVPGWAHDSLSVVLPTSKATRLLGWLGTPCCVFTYNNGSASENNSLDKTGGRGFDGRPTEIFFLRVISH